MQAIQLLVLIVVFLFIMNVAITWIIVDKAIRTTRRESDRILRLVLEMTHESLTDTEMKELWQVYKHRF